jgi:heme/copper-type cytochrome/quinol oxidase subunit 2
VSYHYKQPDKTLIPAALQNVANSIAGKKVDSLPIILSGVIFIIMLISVVSIIYAMIRSSIISVGRNPMAQSAIYRDIIQLSILVLAIISVSVIAIYFVLTRV